MSIRNKALITLFVLQFVVQVEAVENPRAPDNAAQEVGAIQSAAEVDRRVRSFIGNYCVTCHNADEQNGEVRLDHLAVRISNAAIAQQWRDVLDILNTGDMPPKTASKRPSQDELASVIGTLTENLVTAQKMLRGKGGETAARRLNRVEYINSVRALTGILIPERYVPADENGTEFNTLGWYQTFSPGVLEAYQGAAESAVETMLMEGRKPVQDSRLTRIDTPESRLLGRDESGKDSVRSAVKHYISDPRHKTGLLIYQAEYKWTHYKLRIPNHDFRGEYIVRARVAADESMQEELKFLRVHQEKAAPLYFSLHDAVDAPKVIEFKALADAEGTVELSNLRRSQLRPAITRAMKRGKPVPKIWIDWIEVEGPVYVGRHVQLREQLLQGVNERQIASSDARRILNRFAAIAFRGSPVQPQFIDDLLVIFEQELDTGKSPLESLVKPMAVVLTAPQFLYLTENKSHRSEEATPAPLASHEMASRLSFMLWKEPPSDVLLAAGDRLLHDRTFLESTLDAMIADPRFQHFIDEFFGQWLELRRFDEVQVDSKSKTSPLFDTKTRQAVRRQPLEFIKLIIKEDLSLTKLIDAEFSVFDQNMTGYYEDLQPYRSKASWNEFKQVQLTPQNQRRGGLLGMPAIQMIGSSGVETSPVERGAWIARTLLNSPPPPPPPNVPQLTVDPKLTVRQSLERHKQIAQCYSCHKKIDDMGLALETFDALGRWRSRYKDGTPIETAGHMPDGVRFANADDMKQRLLDHKDSMIRSLVEALIVYSLSREAEFTDQKLVDHLVRHSKDNGYRLKPLLLEFVSSKTFTHK